MANKRCMKLFQLLLLASIAIASPAQAGLGWTLQECKIRYGEPTAEYRHDMFGYRVDKFDYAGFLIITCFSDDSLPANGRIVPGRVICVLYTFPIRNGSPNYNIPSEEEFMNVVNQNSLDSEISFSRPVAEVLTFKGANSKFFGYSSSPAQSDSGYVVTGTTGFSYYDANNKMVLVGLNPDGGYASPPPGTTIRFSMDFSTPQYWELVHAGPKL
jgi:hypothetical protein